MEVELERFGDDDEITVIPETCMSADDSSNSDGEDADATHENEDLHDAMAVDISHMLTFKCIGCTKDDAYQETFSHHCTVAITKGKLFLARLNAR